MPLTKSGCGVPIHLQHLGEHRRALWDRCVVAGIVGTEVRDRSHADRVIVASGHESGSRRRTKSRHMKSVVPQATVSKPVECWCGNEAAKSLRLSKACIVNQDKEHIGRALRGS